MCLLCRKHLHTSQSISPSVCLHNAIPKTFSGRPRYTLKSECTRPRANTQKRTKARPEANAQRHQTISLYLPVFWYRALRLCQQRSKSRAAYFPLGRASVDPWVQQASMVATLCRSLLLGSVLLTIFVLEKAHPLEQQLPPSDGKAQIEQKTHTGKDISA